MISNVDSIDWSKYPPDRVEGLKYFFCKELSDEAGPPTEEELKMMCLTWKCEVNMKVDNFLFWLMKKTKEKNFNGSEKRYQRNIPKLFAALEKTGFAKYVDYQERYADKNREYLERCAEWRKKKLWQIRYLAKLRMLCSTWTSDSEGDSDSEDESNDGKKRQSDSFTFSSNSSVDTVVDTFSRYNSYLETESQHLHSSIYDNVVKEEVVDYVDVVGDHVDVEGVDVDVEGDDVDVVGDVNTQSFLPETTSTQK